MVRNIWWQQWDTTFGGSSGIQLLVAAVGYNFWWQQWDTNSPKKIKKLQKLRAWELIFTPPPGGEDQKWKKKHENLN